MLIPTTTAVNSHRCVKCGENHRTEKCIEYRNLRLDVHYELMLIQHHTYKLHCSTQMIGQNPSRNQKRQEFKLNTSSSRRRRRQAFNTSTSGQSSIVCHHNSRTVNIKYFRFNVLNSKRIENLIILFNLSTHHSFKQTQNNIPKLSISISNLLFTNIIKIIIIKYKHSILPCYKCISNYNYIVIDLLIVNSITTSIRT